MCEDTEETVEAMHFTGTSIGVNCGTTPSGCRLLAGLRAALIDNEFGALICSISAGTGEDVRIGVWIPTPPEGEESGWPERVMVSVRDSFLRGVEKHGDSCPSCFTGLPLDRKWGVVPWSDGGVVPPMLGEVVPEDHPYAVQARESAAAEVKAVAEGIAPCDRFPVEFAAVRERDAFHAALHTTLGEAVRAQEVMRLADAWVDAECKARGLRTTEDMQLRSCVAYMRDSRDKAEARIAEMVVRMR